MKTVETYQAHIKEKLALRNARELVQRAIEWRMNETGRERLDQAPVTRGASIHRGNPRYQTQVFPMPPATGQPDCGDSPAAP